MNKSNEDEMKRQTSKTHQTILIADDEHLILKMLGMALSETFPNYSVEKFRNADSLVERVKTAKQCGTHEMLPCLIISDNNMNDGYGSSGLYAAEKIKALDSRIPFVLTTGRCTDEVVEKANELGIAAIFEKPYDLEDFLEKIAQYIQDKS